MHINDFKLERFFAVHEFSAKYLLSCSDCDGYDMNYVLNCADEDEKSLWNNLTLSYTESTGHPALKDAILKHYNSFSENSTHQLGRENIITASPGELAFSLMNVLLKSTDHAIVISPSYQSLYETIRSIGSEISFWKPDEESWKFHIGDLKKLIKKNTKLIIINFPHNPTGSYLTIGEYNELISIARENGIYIYSDEMYYKLNYLNEYPVLPPMAKVYEKGISMWGTAKSFGMAGLRMGWLVSKDIDLIRKVASFKDYLSICSSAPSEILSIIALNHSEKFIGPNIEKIKNNIAFFKEYLQSNSTFCKFFSNFIEPKAGSVAFIKINCNSTSLVFSNKLLEIAGIMTVPAEMFEYDGKYIRIGFGRKNFQDILSKF
jgi:aspartate/methionine/tyrosine aminotransferase